MKTYQTDMRTNLELTTQELCAVIEEYKRELRNARQHIHQLEYIGGHGITHHQDPFE